MTQALTPIVWFQFLVLLAAAGAFLVFALSAARVLPAFAQPISPELRRGKPIEPRENRWQRRAIRFAGLSLAVVHLTLVATTPVASLGPLVAALMLYGVAIALTVWVDRTLAQHPPALARATAQPERLIVHGPFRVLRQPAYSASLCAWAAGCLATFNPWFLVVTTWVAAFYVVAALHQEERLERGAFAGAYREYRRSTGLLFPRIQVEMGQAARPTYL